MTANRRTRTPLATAVAVTMSVLLFGGIVHADPAFAQQETRSFQGAGLSGNTYLTSTKYYPHSKPLTSTIDLPDLDATVSQVAIVLRGLTAENTANSVRFELEHNGVLITLVPGGRCLTESGNVTLSATSRVTYASRPEYSCTSGNVVLNAGALLSSFANGTTQGKWVLKVYSSKNVAMAGWDLNLAYQRNISYSWSTGPWSQWSTTCGAATRSRGATCMGSNGSSYEDSYCQAVPSPTLVEASEITTGCGYEWLTTAWAGPSACGAVQQVRQAYCRRSDGKTVPDAECDAQTRPEVIQSATDYTTCTYQVIAGEWQAPAAACGETTRTRDVACLRSDGTQVLPVLREGRLVCGGIDMPSPAEAVIDTTGCVYNWVQTGARLSACVDGFQTYDAYYTCMGDAAPADSSLCTMPIPPTGGTQSCEYWQENFDKVTPETLGIPYTQGGAGGGTGEEAPHPEDESTGSGPGGHSGGGGSGSVPCDDPASTKECEAGAGGGGIGPSVGQAPGGGTYDPEKDIYTAPDGSQYTGGRWDGETRTYYDSVRVTPAGGGVVVFRRPIR